MAQQSLGLRFYYWHNTITLHRQHELSDATCTFFYTRLCIRVYLKKWVTADSVNILALVFPVPFPSSHLHMPLPTVRKKWGVWKRHLCGFCHRSAVRCGSPTHLQAPNPPVPVPDGPSRGALQPSKTVGTEHAVLIYLSNSCVLSYCCIQGIFLGAGDL